MSTGIGRIILKCQISDRWISFLVNRCISLSDTKSYASMLWFVCTGKSLFYSAMGGKRLFCKSSKIWMGWWGNQRRALGYPFDCLDPLPAFCNCIKNSLSVCICLPAPFVSLEERGRRGDREPATSPSPTADELLLEALWSSPSPPASPPWLYVHPAPKKHMHTVR